MENKVITREDERIRAFFKALENMLASIENLVTEYKPTLNGEQFLTDKEVSEKLKISRRTLQDYRTQGKLPYIHLGGKVIYRESDIEKLLEDNYRKALQ